MFALLYVDAGQAMLSAWRGPLLRCTLRDPAFFQACRDALAAGETVSQDCRFFDGWVEDCVEEAEPECF